MPVLKRTNRIERNTITYLPVDAIYPSSVQPRKRFQQEALTELSESITQYGVLNPLTVRKRGQSYELIAGERRLRAASLAGLHEVPCIVIDANMGDASLVALVEDLQRRDLRIRLRPPRRCVDAWPPWSAACRWPAGTPRAASGRWRRRYP